MPSIKTSHAVANCPIFSNSLKSHWKSIKIATKLFAVDQQSAGFEKIANDRKKASDKKFNYRKLEK